MGENVASAEQTVELRMNDIKDIFKEQPGIDVPDEIVEANPDAEKSPSGPEENVVEVDNGPKTLRIELPVDDVRNPESASLSPRDLDQLQESIQLRMQQLTPKSGFLFLQTSQDTKNAHFVKVQEEKVQMIKELLQEVESHDDKQQVITEMNNMYERREVY